MPIWQYDAIESSPKLSSIPSNRGDSRLTIVNQTVDQRLFQLLLPPHIQFNGDAILSLDEPGRYANTRALRKAREK